MLLESPNILLYILNIIIKQNIINERTINDLFVIFDEKSLINSTKSLTTILILLI
jgi:hypothetical protein